MNHVCMFLFFNSQEQNDDCEKTENENCHRRQSRRCKKTMTVGPRQGGRRLPDEQ